MERVVSCSDWAAYMTALRAERAAAEAAQQACAEQHHQHVIIRSLWESLGAAVALRRAADQRALMHGQRSRQQQVRLASPGSCCVGFTHTKATAWLLFTKTILRCFLHAVLPAINAHIFMCRTTLLRNFAVGAACQASHC